MTNGIAVRRYAGIISLGLWIVLAGTALAGTFGPNGIRLEKYPPRTRAGPDHGRMDERRLDNILPDLMRREGIDLWLVIAQEPDPGPVYFTFCRRHRSMSSGRPF